MTSTDVLERYLAEIARNLPLSAQRDDIVAEISDEIQTRVESGEATMYDAIKAYGHPKIVAARYDSQQVLVGSQLLPFYWYTLKLVMSIVIGIEIFGAAMSGFSLGKPSMFFEGLGAAWSSVPWVFGIVTIIFILLERFAKGPIVPFDPATLPKPSDAPTPRFSSAFEFTANFMMLCVLMFGGHIFANIISPLVLTGAWVYAWYGAVISSALVSGAAFAVYLTPHWTKVRTVVGFISYLVTLVGASLTLRAGLLVTQSGTSVGPVELGVVNMIAAWSIGFTILGVAIAAVVALVKLVTSVVLRRPSTSSG